MGWFENLVSTFDLYADLAGVVVDGQPVLTPLSHSTYVSQIEITIDKNGNFISSQKVDNETILVPVTEDSASRSSGDAPHPLCDNISYVAGDFYEYSKDEKLKNRYNLYIEGLRKWTESDDSHYMVRAVYEYTKKGTVLHDLIEAGTVIIDDKIAATKEKQIADMKGKQIRFVVESGPSPEPRVWMNTELREKYIQYYQKEAGTPGFCCATGEYTACTTKHPAKLIKGNNCANAKLISSTDETGLRYYGRFETAEQALSVGYDVSQKAHSALKWLLEKQGCSNGNGTATVCWVVNRDMPLPDIKEDSVNAFLQTNDSEFDDLFAEFDNKLSNDAEQKPDTGKHYAEQFANAIRGYGVKIKEDDRIAIISVSSVTKGRLSITHYEEMGGKQFMGALMNWYEHCKWSRSVIVNKKETRKDKDKKAIRKTLECTPSPREMVLAAYGIQRENSHGSQRGKTLEADEKMIETTVKRILPCITNPNRKIPEDIIRAAAQRLSSPEKMDSFIWKNDVMNVTCAMFRLNYERNGKNMDKFLEENENNRNVLWGRLLAIYDYMETRAMYSEFKNSNERETNAVRYWNVFSKTPLKAYDTLVRNLKPYEKKLSGIEKEMFESWISEIMGYLTKTGEFNSKIDRPLSVEYVPAYYLQLDLMKTAFKERFEQMKKKDEKSDEE